MARNQGGGGGLLDPLTILGGLWSFWARLSFAHRLLLLVVLLSLWLIVHYPLWGTAGPFLDRYFPGMMAAADAPMVRLGEATGVGLLVLGGVGYVVLRRRSAAKQRAQSARLAEGAQVLKVLNPPGDTTKWQTMSSFYTTLRQSLAVSSMDIWQGRGVHVSLEFSSDEEGMGAFIWLPNLTDTGTDLVRVVVTQLRAIYQAITLQTTPDPLRTLGDSGVIWLELGLAGDSYLPLATTFPASSDPLSNLLSALTPDGSVAAMGMQVVCRPASDEWVQQGAQRAAQLHTEVQASAVKAGMSETRTLARAIEEKKDKLGFDVRVRLWARPQSEADSNAVAQRLRALADAFRVFDGHNQWVTRAQGQDPEVLRERRWAPFSTPVILNCDELAALWHLPTANTTAPGMATSSARRLSPPSTMIVPSANSKDYRVLGGHDFGDGRTEVEVGVSYEMARRHMIGIGQTGTGKSTMIVNCVVQDIEAGHGVVVMDPNFDLIHDTLARIPAHRERDVVLLDPGDPRATPGINPLEVLPGDDPIQVASDMLENFQVVMGANWETSVRMQRILRLALLTLTQDAPNHNLADLARMLSDMSYLHDMVGRVKDPLLARSWEGLLAQGDEEVIKMMQPPLTRIDALLLDKTIRNVFVQARSTVRWRELIDNRKIVLCNFAQADLGEENARILTVMTFSMLFRAAMRRLRDTTSESDRVPFFVYVDEAPGVVNSSAKRIESILSQWRKAGGGLALFAQYMFQFDQQIQKAAQGNIFTTVTFRVGPDDAKQTSYAFAGSITPQDAMGLPPYHVFVRQAGLGTALLRTYPKPPERERVFTKERATSSSRQSVPTASLPDPELSVESPTPATVET
jgi:hypothetical protein